MLLVLIPLEVVECRWRGEHIVCKVAVMVSGAKCVSMSSIVRIVQEVLKLTETQFEANGMFKFSMLLAGWEQMRYMTTLTTKERAMVDLLSAPLERQKGESTKSKVISHALCNNWVTFRLIGSRNRLRPMCNHDADFPHIRPDEWNKQYSALQTLRRQLDKFGPAQLPKFDFKKAWPVYVRDGMCGKRGVNLISL